MHKQVMLKMISFSVGPLVHFSMRAPLKTALASWAPSINIIIIIIINTFPVLHAFIVNVKLSAGWIDLMGNPI